MRIAFKYGKKQKSKKVKKTKLFVFFDVLKKILLNLRKNIDDKLKKLKIF